MKLILFEFNISLALLPTDKTLYEVRLVLNQSELGILFIEQKGSISDSFGGNTFNLGQVPHS